MNVQQNNSQRKKLWLMEEIQKYQQSIESYKNIEREIQGLEKELASQKSINQEINSTSSFHPAHKRSMNSHKKIKLYELQKKISTKKKQLKEKSNAFSKKIQALSNIEENTKKINFLIKQQDKDTISLNQTQTQIEKKLFYMVSQCEEIEKLMKEEKLILHKYQHKKETKEQNIRKMKKQLKIASDQTEPDESIMDISQSSDIESLDDSEKMFSVREIFRDPRYEFSKKATNRCSKRQLKEMIENKIFLIEKGRAKNADLSSFLRKLHVENRGKQTSSKHYKITVDLQMNKIQSLIDSISFEATTIRKKQNKMMGLSDKLSKLEGERGRLRGKLGIKVENVRLLNLINGQLKADFEQFKNKFQLLKLIQQRCRGIDMETDNDFLLTNQ